MGLLDFAIRKAVADSLAGNRALPAATTSTKPAATRAVATASKLQPVQLPVNKGRSVSAPTSLHASAGSSGRRMSIKEELPRVAFRSRRQSITSPYFFEKSLNIHDLPRNTKEFQAYAKLSKLSDAEMQQVLIDIELTGFQFRSPHEVKMAIVSMNDVAHTGRARTPLSEEWRKKSRQKAEEEQQYQQRGELEDIESSLSSDDGKLYF